MKDSPLQPEADGRVRCSAWLGGIEPGRLMHEETTALDDFWATLSADEKAVWREREERVMAPAMNLLRSWCFAARTRPPHNREIEMQKLMEITERVMPPNAQRSGTANQKESHGS